MTSSTSQDVSVHTCCTTFAYDGRWSWMTSAKGCWLSFHGATLRCSSKSFLCHRHSAAFPAEQRRHTPQIPSTEGAPILNRHSGQVPNCRKTLEAHWVHKHRWPQDRVTLACLSMHTTQSFTLPLPAMQSKESQSQDIRDRCCLVKHV